MTKRKRVILTSFSVILLCLCSIIGITYALFTDSVSVENHLQAGSLEVSLTRTHLEYCVLDEEGYLHVYEEEADLELTTSTKENVFGLTATDCKIAPGSYFDAQLELENKGTVAFTYNVTIKLLSESNALSEQLEVTVTHSDGSVTTKKLSELNAGLKIEAGEMTSEITSQTFSVKVEFIDDSNNNSAQSQSVIFDLIVEAVQATK